MGNGRKIPNLIIRVEDKPYTTEDVTDWLALYSAQLYKMSKMQTSSKHIPNIGESESPHFLKSLVNLQETRN